MHRTVIHSMTGFGRAEVVGEECAVTVEARSVNHRHLDLAMRLPRSLANLEMEARRVAQARLGRGRVDIGIQLGPAPGRALQRVQVDTGLAREYLAQARALGRDAGLTGEVPLTWVLERPGVVRTEEVSLPDALVLWPAVRDALERALDALVAQRAAEGALLVAELRSLLATLGAEVDLIAARAPDARDRKAARLRERVAALLGDVTLDETRIAMEVALWADRTDITEEIARLRAHLGQLGELLERGGPVGRPLDFLLQELNREVNTVASKVDELELSRAALAAKGILEKMREQVQNLE
jgi:uncharacterized protein (TIGR00255 family)